jgi:hypothetical protein
MRYQHVMMPTGIRIKAQPARKTGPLLKAAATRDCSLIGGSLIREDGVFRLWYESWPRAHFEAGTPGSHNALRYAESDDGRHWNLKAVPGGRACGVGPKNVVYGLDRAPFGFHGASVFRDDHAPKSERYKCVHLAYGNLPTDAVARYCRRWPRDVDPLAISKKHLHALCGAVSPDGFRWTPRRDFLLLQTTDTQNICEYDPVLRLYVAYVRAWVMGRRTIARAVSKDFRHFNFPEEVFWPGPDQPPDALWYANAKTTMPDAPDCHVMFPARWDLTSDQFAFHLAVSPDNAMWHLVPGGPVGQPGNPGAWDGGVVWPGRGLVELPGRRMGLLYCGTPITHKFPRRPPLGALGWAWWDWGRLTALEAPADGAFTLWPLKVKGRTARLNMRTRLTGFVQVQAFDEKDQPIPGRTFEDSDPICGDYLDRLVTWRGESDLGHNPGAWVCLGFRLRHAELFSVRFDMKGT